MSATIIKLPYSTTRRANARSPRCSANGTPAERAAKPRVAANMLAVVFQSDRLIFRSSEADLVRDVRLDVDKAKVKLRRIRDRMVRDRENAAARDT